MDLQWPRSCTELLTELGRRFQDSLVLRIERKAEILGRQPEPQMLRAALGEWLGAAADEILKD